MPESVRVVRRSLSRLYLCEGTDEQDAIDALRSEGEVLKRTPKTITKRVGDWVVKSSRYNFGLGPLARTTLRARYRRGWQASLRLRQRGVDAPAPRAFIERGACGVIAGNTLITDYLHGYLGIEEWLTSNPAYRGGDAVMDRFLESLADALTRLTDAGAVHSDLAGKNILTLDGTGFFFIDLDDVQLDVPYTIEMRARNHSQIWSSLRHFCGEDEIAPFLSKVLPQGHTLDEWTDAVRQRSRARLGAADPRER